MKRKIVTIIALTLLLPVLLLGYGALLPSYYGQSYYGQLSAMYEKLEKTTGRRLVIVGGSNVAFGVDAAQLEETLQSFGYDYTVCNFGLYAAVGTGAMLSLSEELIRPGDLVVLAIEPTQETFSDYFGATAMLKCAEDTPKMLLRLDRSQQSAVVGNYLSYLQERAQIRRTGLLPQPEGVYGKASFDANGDMRYDRAGNAMPLGYDTAQIIDLAGLRPQESFVTRLNAYIRKLESRGATVVMSFSPMNRSALADDSEEAVNRFFTTLRESFSCRIISDPNRYIFDSGWFYDSNFHLNTAGMALRTWQLSCDVLGELGCYEKVPFAMPQIPPSIAQTATEDTDTDVFLFESVGENGLLVTGLTRRGLEATVLTVPASCNGKSVVGLSGTAFAGNTRLRELTLPATIESIPDGAFSGCTALGRLTLLHTGRTPAVGAGLFDGAPGLTVFVPEQAYHLYRDGAGCESNPWQMYLSRITAYETNIKE